MKRLTSIALVASCASAPTYAATAPQKLTIAVVGDLILPHSPPDVATSTQLASVARVLREADAGFGNFEGSIFDYATFKGSPAAENGGGLPLTEPRSTQTLKSLGITLVSRANNHAVDFGVEGMLASNDVLSAAGIAHAGSGVNETEARAPAYLDTPAGRLALVATTSTFPRLSPAADPVTRSGLLLKARAGQSVLRTRKVNLVSADEFAALRSIAARETAYGPLVPAALSSMPLRIGEETFELSERTGLRYEMISSDRDRILSEVRSADEKAVAVVFSIHSHETASGGSEDPMPANFLPELFHAAIDSGADLVVRHGPHALAGIEIYQGRPIFYGMASLFFPVGYPNGRMPYMVGNERREAELPRSWFESVIALCDFENGSLIRIRLYPIVLSLEASTYGEPRPARGADAQRILERLRRASEPFAVQIESRGDIGMVFPPRKR